MGFKMKGSAYKLNDVATKSALKNYRNPQDYKVFNMGNKPTPMKQETKEQAYKRIIEEKGMTKNEKGYWVDKEGRSPRHYYDAEQGGVLPGEQRERNILAG
jgi:hypothetical protein